MAISSNDVAECALSTFYSLPAKRKPRVRDGDSCEWVPLSGIILCKDDKDLSCVSLGTGMKCLPASKVAKANGAVLHDCHAEILAIRAFNRFLIQECACLVADNAASSIFVRRREPFEMTPTDFQPFGLDDDVKVFMYSSEAPCGDASMELIMDAQEDATPWPTANRLSTECGYEAEQSLLGRGYFSELGIVRRKPARADAPSSLSKSCSDKLSLKQCTSLLNSVTSLILHPSNAYLHTLVLPQSQHVPSALSRAFGPTGRLSALPAAADRYWQDGYRFSPFRVESTNLEFPLSRRQASGGRSAIVPSNLCAVYTPHFQETLIGGTLQGRKQFDLRGASAISRRGLWKAVAEVASMMALPVILEACRQPSYDRVKSGDTLRARRDVKSDVKRLALKGWTSNVGDGQFSLA